MQKPQCRKSQLLYFQTCLTILCVPDRFSHSQFLALKAALVEFVTGLQMLATGPIVCFSAGCRGDLQEVLKVARKDGLQAENRAVHLSSNIFQHGHSWISWAHQNVT